MERDLSHYLLATRLLCWPIRDLSPGTAGGQLDFVGAAVDDVVSCYRRAAKYTRGVML